MARLKTAEAIGVCVAVAADNHSSALNLARPHQFAGIDDRRGMQLAYLRSFESVIEAVGISMLGYGTNQLPALFQRAGNERASEFVEQGIAIAQRYGRVAAEEFFEQKTAAAPRGFAGPRMKSRLLKTYAVLLLFIAQKAAGNLSLAWGMKRLPSNLPENPGANPLLYIRAMFDPFVAAGIAALILALLTRMALLSLADLSFVLPVTAIGYVMAAFLGKVVLNEEVTGRRWAGTALICIGAALVGSTSRTTTEVGEKSP